MHKIVENFGFHINFADKYYYNLGTTETILIKHRLERNLITCIHREENRNSGS